MTSIYAAKPWLAQLSDAQVVPGYWRLPDATAEAFPDGELRTGDVGFMDAEAGSMSSTARRT